MSTATSRSSASADTVCTQTSVSADTAATQASTTVGTETCDTSIDVETGAGKARKSGVETKSSQRCVIPAEKCPSCCKSDFPAFSALFVAGILLVMVVILFFVAILPTIRRKSWEQTACNVTDTHFYWSDKCDVGGVNNPDEAPCMREDCGCIDMQYCNVTLTYDASGYADPSLATTVVVNPFIVEYDSDGDTHSSFMQGAAICEHYKDHPVVDCWFNPDDYTEVVLAVEPPRITIWFAIVASALCCLCVCCAVITFRVKETPVAT